MWSQESLFLNCKLLWIPNIKRIQRAPRHLYLLFSKDFLEEAWHLNTVWFFSLHWKLHSHWSQSYWTFMKKKINFRAEKGLFNKSDKNKFSGCLSFEKLIKPLHVLVKGFLSRGVSFLGWHLIDKVSQSFNIYEYLSHLLLLCFQLQHISI